MLIFFQETVIREFIRKYKSSNEGFTIILSEEYLKYISIKNKEDVIVTDAKVHSSDVLHKILKIFQWNILYLPPFISWMRIPSNIPFGLKVFEVLAFYFRVPKVGKNKWEFQVFSWTSLIYFVSQVWICILDAQQ